MPHDVYHLAADRTCLTRCEVAVVALLEVNAYFVCALHLKTVHGFLCLRYVNLIAVIS